MTGTVICRCGTVLSPDGARWVRSGYRLSARVDGTPLVGKVGRPDAKGGRIMCKPCATQAVAAKRAQLKAGR